MKKIRISRPMIGKKEIWTTVKVLRSGNLAQSVNVEKFENLWSQMLGNRHAVAVNSGTSALHLCLLSLGIKSGDEVLVPSFTFIATANAVRLVGATPIFVDTDRETFNISIPDIQQKITNKTRAIIVVHLFGNPVDIDQIRSVIGTDSLLIIEDAAQAHGAQIRNRTVGNLADAACFSFYATKNMTTAEGGIIVFESSEAAQEARILRNQGMQGRYDYKRVGFNLRMNEIQAAIGIEQFKKLYKFNKKRRENADQYQRDLNSNYFKFQSVLPEACHVYHQFTVRVPAEHRASLMKYLEQFQIESNIFYPAALDSLRFFNQNVPKCVNSRLLTEEVLSLPVGPHLKKRDIRRVIQVANDYWDHIS